MGPSNLDISSLLNQPDDTTFRSNLEDWLSNHSFDLPLEDACSKGGRPEIDEFVIGEITRSNREVTCMVTVDFTEVFATSCAKVELDENHGCLLRLVIDEDLEVIEITVENLYGGDRFFDD